MSGSVITFIAVSSRAAQWPSAASGGSPSARVSAWLAVLTATLVLFTKPVSAQELLTNNGFETGSFAGWQVNNLAGGSGDFYVDNDGVAPSGILTVGPAAGSYYALSDQGGPGTHSLAQSFTVPAGTTLLTLAFNMFVNDSDGGPIVNPAGLDHTANPNQHARVDLLTNAGFTANPFTTAGADVIQNFYLGVDPQVTNPNPYTPYSFNITALVVPGQTYWVRFGEVDNQLFLNQGVDKVSVFAVPEPAALSLLVLPALASRRRRRR